MTHKSEGRAGSRTMVDLAGPGRAAALWVGADDDRGVHRAARAFADDLERVSGRRPEVVEVGGPEVPSAPPGTTLVVVGTLGRHPVVDRWVRAGLVDVGGIEGTWEATVTQGIEPGPLVPEGCQVLVVAGSDRRGAIYGLYRLSAEIGVSPWTWWADVPVRKAAEVRISGDRRVQTSPAVKYRGIFLNDEAPALTHWVLEKFGGYNSSFYTHVFDLLLRLGANLLWPAMWNNAFSLDDPENPRLADEVGIVMGTSHHEPMLRAHKEWTWTGEGPWDYRRNAETLKDFWRAGVARNGGYESLVTLGMRGDGDEPMAGEAHNVALLERIVADQRQLLAEAGRSSLPQVWALYKEVQGYYERGMRVPDDVTLLWSDDNWSHLRRLPTAAEGQRAGGAGIYYHLDYVGGPRNYKWLSTVPLGQTYDQMTLAYQAGADRIWIVNVGDLKPHEQALDFFLTLAWDPAAWAPRDVTAWAEAWALRQTGSAEAAALIEETVQALAWPKPELLEPETFSLDHWDEAAAVEARWAELVDRVRSLGARIPEDHRDAYFQLVAYPAEAGAQAAGLWIAAGRNHRAAAQGRALAGRHADRAEAHFQADRDLTDAYHALGQGRWNHFMDQTRFGYTHWQQPEVNALPPLIRIAPPAGVHWGLAVEGDPHLWPGRDRDPRLPVVDRWGRGRRTFEVFRRGQEPFEVTAAAEEAWVEVSPTRARIDDDVTFTVTARWAEAPRGDATATVRFTGPDGVPLLVRVPVRNVEVPPGFEGFVEGDGVVALDAAEAAARTGAGPVRWVELPPTGPWGPSLALSHRFGDRFHPVADAPWLEYRFFLTSTGPARVAVVLTPGHAVGPGRGLAVGLSWDGGPWVVADALADDSEAAWEASVITHQRRLTFEAGPQGPGVHSVRVAAVDPQVVVQRVEVDRGGLGKSTFGPSLSRRYCPQFGV